MTTAALPPLREVVARHGLGARKGLGQHFLLDGNLTDRIVRTAGVVDGTHVIEVGPGPGGLTRSLLKAGARVWAVEKDPRCLDALAELAAAFPGRLTVVAGDALDIDTVSLAPAPRRVVANLPYNVSTPLLLGWLRRAEAFASLTLMFQREVADRLVAHPGTKAYGRLSVVTQWRCAVRVAFHVDRRAFVPPPKVMSTVVDLVPRPEPLAPASWTALETVTAAAFGQRRKMLRKSLSALGLDPQSIGLDPTLRAEDVDVNGFCALARALGGGRKVDV